MPQLDTATLTDALRRFKPASVRAWTTDGAERRVPVPDRHRRWQAVVETVSTLHAHRVELVDSSGGTLHVLDSGGPIAAAGHAIVQGERLDNDLGAGASIAALARAIVSSQQVALDAHVDASKHLVGALLKQQELSNRRLETLEKLLVQQMQLAHELSTALVEQRMETAETAAAALESKDDQTGKLIEMGTQLLQLQKA
jgi:hypothetical protein